MLAIITNNIVYEVPMITIAVCDNDVTFSKYLALSAGKISNDIGFQEYLNFSVTEFNCAKDVLTYLDKYPINILLLDIDMPQMNGFDLAGKLNKLFPDIIIIFVSSHENFVYSSFEYRPFRFLRKSHIDDELQSALSKAIEKCMVANDILAFNTIKKDIVLRTNDILYFEVDKNYFLIHTVDDVYKCRGTLCKLEEDLKEFNFYRIHAAFIVNMENIDKLKHGTEVQLTNKKFLPISQKKASGFKKAYMAFLRKRFLK